MRRMSGPLLAGGLVWITVYGPGCSPSRTDLRIDHYDRSEPVRSIYTVTSIGGSNVEHAPTAIIEDASIPTNYQVNELGSDAPSNVRCRLDRPAGDCDRCPDHACLQVLVMHGATGAEWIPFCDQGNVREEARIACLCAGGTESACTLSASDTAMALSLVNHIFGGNVPEVGHRYRDSNGLRRVVGENEHAWLSARVTAPLTMRCGPLDHDGAEARYTECAHQVRTRSR